MGGGPARGIERVEIEARPDPMTNLVIRDGLAWKCMAKDIFETATPGECAAEIEQLRGNLSLAEDGLASATQEIAELKRWQLEARKLMHGGPSPDELPSHVHGAESCTECGSIAASTAEPSACAHCEAPELHEPSGDLCAVCDGVFIDHRHGAKGHDWQPKPPEKSSDYPEITVVRTPGTGESV